MHHSTKRRVVLGMTTGGLLLTGIGMGVAQADATAEGGASNSPGVASGNLIQIPINAPINLCGNDISVVGILDSAFGNQCANADGGAGGATGGNGATAAGSAKDSPGVGSGNLIQVPINAPINLCGNDVSGVGVGDKAVDNTCVNGGGPGSNTSGASGGSHNSPGVGSGNTLQLPINAPVNVCGEQMSVIGIGDTAAGNTCANGGPVPPVSPPSHSTPPCGCGQPSTPPTTYTPAPPPATSTSGTPSSPSTPTGASSSTGSHNGSSGASGSNGSGGPTGSLAETGTGAAQVMAPLGAGVLGGGTLLLRKRMASLHHLTHRQH